MDFSTFLIAASFGVIVRIGLQFCKQQWATTFYNTVTYLSLPVVALVITETISGDLALSLGMVGALSIIRFRHPVKSPLELLVFFLLLTAGITLSVNPNLAIQLVIFFLALLIMVQVTSMGFTYFNKNLFNTSFSDGSSKSILTVSTNSRIAFLISHPKLVALFIDEDLMIWEYKLASSSSRELIDLMNVLEDNPENNSKFQLQIN